MSLSKPRQIEQEKSARKARRKAAKILEAQPMFVGGLLADRSEEARKEKRVFFTRSRNRLHLQQDVCILQHFPEQVYADEPQPSVTITVTNPDGLMLYPHDIRTWPTSVPKTKPTRMSSSEKRAFLYERVVNFELEILDIVREAYACPRLVDLTDKQSSVRKALRQMARDILAGKEHLSSSGPFPREERRKTRRWLAAAYKCYDDLNCVVYQLVRCERKSLDLGLLPARFEWVVREFPSYGSC